jgi:hypothetical protein
MMTVVPQRLRICWSWNGSGKWEAPANPRLAFARYSALCKLYVITDVSSSKNSSPSDEHKTAEDLLRQLLPALQSELAQETGSES